MANVLLSNCNNFLPNSKVFEKNAVIYSMVLDSIYIKNIEINVGCQIDSLIGNTTLDKEVLQSIFNLIDDGNGIIDRQEVDMLQQIGKKINLEKKSLKQIYKFLKKKIDKYKNNINTKSTSQPIKTNWSESLDRIVSNITISLEDTELRQELLDIGKELNIQIDILERETEDDEPIPIWLEDYAIKRADGKRLSVSDSTLKKYQYYVGTKQKMDNFGVVCLERNTNTTDAVYTDSYLEGGNVLNTLNSIGEPAAIIGKDTLEITRCILDLTDSEEDLLKVKQKIANDLGLKEENVTYIPQHIFHIDMTYQPLKQGEIMVPDYNSAIEIIDNMLKYTDNKDKNEQLKAYKKRIIEENEKSGKQILSAYDKLEKSGYKLTKIPCFTTGEHSSTNHMNGIFGTTKEGIKFYITNKSDISEFDEIIKSHLEKLGIDNIYFLSTQEFLKMNGGICCLTQKS